MKVTLILLFICSISVVSLCAQTQTLNSESARDEKLLKRRASGTFDVKVTPVASTDQSTSFVRLLLDKQFRGDLEGSSKGEMLTIDNGSTTSGGYVAIELINGTLNGRRGTFALQHSGTMVGSKMELSIKVVPESGTGELSGLAGQMTIKIDGTKHSFDFDYTLAPKPVAQSKD